LEQLEHLEQLEQTKTTHWKFGLTTFKKVYKYNYDPTILN
jgi:hypothetical protein